jgi:hypothetical protein
VAGRRASSRSCCDDLHQRAHAVEQKGFTERQARFLTTVMLHAGVCIHVRTGAVRGDRDGEPSAETCDAESRDPASKWCSTPPSKTPIWCRLRMINTGNGAVGGNHEGPEHSSFGDNLVIPFLSGEAEAVFLEDADERLVRNRDELAVRQP